MKKNVSGQSIGAQMVSASDGSAFAGSVTVYVTGDAGTQAVGSVGSGACTHEGNGYHTYAPAQAETNYDLIAFTFIGTGAVPVTIQVFTDYPQTGDAYARLGAPAGASVSADIAAKPTAAEIRTEMDSNSTQLAAIVDDTGASGVVVAAASKTGYSLSASGVQAIWDALTSALTTVGSIGKLLVDNIDATISSRLATSGYTAPLDAAGIRSAVGLASSNLDTQIAALPTAAENRAEMDSNSTQLAAIVEDTAMTLPAQISGLNNLSAADVNAEVVDALATDTYAEPGQGAPGATISLAAKINYLYKSWRNKREQTATTFSLYDDAGATVDQKATVADDGTTFSRTEMGTGA